MQAALAHEIKLFQSHSCHTTNSKFASKKALLQQSTVHIPSPGVRLSTSTPMARLLLASGSFTQELAYSTDSSVQCTYVHARQQGDHVMQDDVISIMAYQKRLKKEYEELSKRAPVGVSLDGSTMEDNVDV